MERLRDVLTDPVRFSHALLPATPLREYQQAPARAIANAVLTANGGIYTWTFSRQSGKDETLSQLLAYLLVRYQLSGGSIIVAAPTLDPQAMITASRLRDRLQQCKVMSATTLRQQSLVISVGRANARFVSAGEQANQRGLTASLLLVANEAQDIDPDVWQARFAPMAASTAAPTLAMGTTWSTNGLLHQLQQTPPPEHHHRVTWRHVAAELPAYDRYVRQEIERLGAEHPYIQTEYELVPLDADAGLFDTHRIKQIEGSHKRERHPTSGDRYGLLVDVAGSSEESAQPSTAYDRSSKRDATTVIVIKIIDDGPNPIYQIVHRFGWTGESMLNVHPQLLNAAETWRARWLIIDATGIGSGLFQLLDRSLQKTRTRVVGHLWTSASKSDAGFRLLGLIDSNRVSDYRRRDHSDTISRALAIEMAATRVEYLPGPGKRIRWSVPQPGHDDVIMALALLPRLDAENPRRRRASGSSTTATES